MADTVQVPRELAERLVTVLEYFELRIENEWGDCKPLARLYADGDVCTELVELKELLK